jgi:hypothetical protein
MSVNSVKIKVFEAFAGYGSQAMALSRTRKLTPREYFRLMDVSEPQNGNQQLTLF